MSIVNKPELIASISDKTGITKKDTESILNAFIDTVKEELAAGNKIQLIGFGTFEVSERAARMGRNPQTGKEMTIEATKVPKFKAGKLLKDAVNT